MKETNAQVPIERVSLKKRDSSATGIGGRKFMPSKEYNRSKSFIKQAGFAYGALNSQRETTKEELQIEKVNTESDDEPSNPLTSSQHIFEQSSSDNVKVCIRVRPLNDREIKSGQGKNKCLRTERETIYLDRGFDMKKFHFDFVGHEQIDQL